jgi:hypothetical protein
MHHLSFTLIIATCCHLSLDLEQSEGLTSTTTMPATLHDLPDELVGLICDHEPGSIPKLRSTCRDLCGKTMQPIAKHFYRIIPVSVHTRSMNTLLRISRHPDFRFATKTLQISMNNYGNHLSMDRVPTEEQLEFVDSGDFRDILEIILTRFTNCTSIILTSTNMTLGGLQNPSAAEINERGGWLPPDRSEIVVDIVSAMASTHTAIKEIRMDNNMARAKFSKFSKLCASLPCSATSIASLEKLRFVLRDDVALSSPTHSSTGHNQVPCLHRGNYEPGDSTNCCADCFLEGFLSHFPALKVLYLEL